MYWSSSSSCNPGPARAHILLQEPKRLFFRNSEKAQEANGHSRVENVLFNRKALVIVYRQIALLFFRLFIVVVVFTCGWGSHYPPPNTCRAHVKDDAQEWWQQVDIKTKLQTAEEKQNTPVSFSGTLERDRLRWQGAGCWSYRLLLQWNSSMDKRHWSNCVGDAFFLSL